MDRDSVRLLLREVAAGRVAPDDAFRRLSFEPVESLEFASVDHHRAVRQGFPEVVFAEGKTPHQVVTISERILAHGSALLVTRTDQPTREALVARFPDVRVNETGRTVSMSGAEPPSPGKGTVLIVTAGTSDLPVAEEAAESAVSMGNAVTRVNDVGVAGIHRVLAHGEALTSARVVIVVAGMDGVLPSVVGGLVGAPVIAVPTSIGYGASFHGIAALLTMLNSCAAGVTVVNIDNGFGAAAAASRITHADD